jgi:multiple sugar transport system substrate-binding protein
MNAGQKIGSGAETNEGRVISRRQFLARGAAFTFAAAVTGPGLTVLSGCGGGRGGSASGPLSFWQFMAPGGPVKEQVRWFEDTVDAWNKENETKVELRYIPVEDYLEGSKLQTAFSAGEGPDIFLISPGDFLRYYNGGVLQDLTPFISNEAQNDFYPSVMATRIVDGKIYGIPMEVEPMAIYYSVKAFEEAGLSEADIPQTWDQLLEVAGKLKTGNRFGVLFETNPGYYQNFTWYPFMWMGGGDAVTQGGTESKFDHPGTVQALEFWQEAVQTGVAPRTAQGTGANDIVANLGSGYCAIQNCGIWGVAALQANAPDFEYGVFKLPLPPDGDYTTDLGGWAFVANSEGKNPEEAAQFCVWALGSMSDDSIQRGTRWSTEADSNLPPRKSVTEQATKQGAYDSGPFKFFMEEAFPGGRGEPRYPPQIYKAVSDAIQACQLDGADPQQQAEQSAQRINDFLQGYSGGRIV